MEASIATLQHNDETRTALQRGKYVEWPADGKKPLQREGEDCKNIGIGCTKKGNCIQFLKGRLQITSPKEMNVHDRKLLRRGRDTDASRCLTHWELLQWALQ